MIALAGIALQYHTGLGCNGFLKEPEIDGMVLPIASQNHLHRSCLSNLCFSYVLRTMVRGWSRKTKFCR